MRVENGPKYLDKSTLYGLKGKEVVLFSVFGTAEDGLLSRRLRGNMMEIDLNLRKFQEEVLEVARKIEAGEVSRFLSAETEDLRGRFKNVKVVVAKHPVTGHRLRGFALIGTPK